MSCSEMTQPPCPVSADEAHAISNAFNDFVREFPPPMLPREATPGFLWKNNIGHRIQMLSSLGVTRIGYFVSQRANIWALLSWYAEAMKWWEPPLPIGEFLVVSQGVVRRYRELPRTITQDDWVEDGTVVGPLQHMFDPLLLWQTWPVMKVMPKTHGDRKGWVIFHQQHRYRADYQKPDPIILLPQTWAGANTIYPSGLLTATPVVPPKSTLTTRPNPCAKPFTPSSTDKDNAISLVEGYQNPPNTPKTLPSGDPSNGSDGDEAYPRFLNHNQESPVTPKEETLRQEDPGIEPYIWPGYGITVEDYLSGGKQGSLVRGRDRRAIEKMLVKADRLPRGLI